MTFRPRTFSEALDFVLKLATTVETIKAASSSELVFKKVTDENGVVRNILHVKKPDGSLVPVPVEE